MAKTMKPAPMRPSAAAHHARLERMAAADAAAADPPPPSSYSLLHGIKFYLSWSIPAERRRELRGLIHSNGGVALKALAPDAVELVENEALQTGKNWVSVDFVYDSVRDQTQRDLTQYMAPDLRAAVTQNNRPAMTVEEPKRKGRMGYTVADDAKMFQFVENYKGKVKSMESVPLSVWKMAERINVTGHSSESMHERYRKILKKYTPQERRNVLQHAQAEENARQRRELAALNGKAASKKAPTQSAASLVDLTTEPTAEATSVTADRVTRPVFESEGPVETQAPNAATADTPETNSSALVATDDETDEDEEIQGRGKKRGRKSQSSDQDKAAASLADNNKKETSREESVAAANESQELPATAPAAPEVAAQDKPVEETGESATIDSAQKTPVVMSKTQQKQKMKRDKAAARSDAESEEEGGDEEPLQKPSSQPTFVADDADEPSSSPPSPVSEMGGTGGIFFTSRWEQLVNDTGNRQLLQQFFTLSCQKGTTAPAAAPRPAVTRGQILRQVSPTRPAIASSPSKAITTVSSGTNNSGDTTSESAASTARRRKRAAAPAIEEEQKQEEEAAPAKPVPTKKRKVRQASPQLSAALSVTTGLSQEAPRQISVQTAQQGVRQEVLVTSEIEANELACQLQFQTDQELNAVVHALYYSSGDVELAHRFLGGGSVTEDFWSLEDDLLLDDDLVSDATDARKVMEARRQGAFDAMRVQRTTAQILTRIRYLL